MAVLAFDILLGGIPVAVAEARPRLVEMQRRQVPAMEETACLFRSREI